jgi:trimethylamine:corrinoid methyltransferase-like protein
MLPTLKNGLPVVEPMSPDQVERIHQASLAILEDVGVVFRDTIALDDRKKAGADVRGEGVHLDRGLVMELIGSIAMTMMAVLLSGANYLWHSAGWNEAGMLHRQVRGRCRSLRHGLPHG